MTKAGVRIAVSLRLPGQAGSKANYQGRLRAAPGDGCNPDRCGLAELLNLKLDRGGAERRELAFLTHQHG